MRLLRQSHPALPLGSTGARSRSDTGGRVQEPGGCVGVRASLQIAVLQQPAAFGAVTSRGGWLVAGAFGRTEPCGFPLVADSPGGEVHHLAPVTVQPRDNVALCVGRFAVGVQARVEAILHLASEAVRLGEQVGGLVADVASVAAGLARHRYLQLR